MRLIKICLLVSSLCLVVGDGFAQTAEKQSPAKSSVAKPSGTAKPKEKAAPKPVTKTLPEAHSFTSYATELTDVGPLSLPIDWELKGQPAWLTLSFTGKMLMLHGEASEISDKTYTLTLDITNHDKSTLHYVLTLPVKVGADEVSLAGSSTKVAVTPPKPQTPVATPAPAPAPAQSPLYLDKNPSVEITSQVYEGVQSISGVVTGIPTGAPAPNVELWLTPKGQQTFLATLKPATGTTPTTPVTKTAIGADGTFTLTLASPLPDNAQPTLRLLQPTGLFFASGKDLSIALSFTGPTIPRPVITLTSVPVAGINTLTGKVAPLSSPAISGDTTTTPAIVGNLPQIFVELVDPVGDRTPYPALLQSGPSTTVLQAPVNSDGTFSLLLKNNLIAGQKLTVKAIPPPGHMFSEGSPDEPRNEVAAKSVIIKSNLQIAEPTINSDLREGVTVISGTATMATSTSGAINVAFLRFYDSDHVKEPWKDDCLTIDHLKELDHRQFLNLSTAANTSATVTSVDATSGTFKATLANALVEGEYIEVVQVFVAGTQPADSEMGKCNSSRLRVHYDYDWFRTNVTFTAGVLLSNSSSGTQASADFSQANQFYALNVERAWRLPGVDCVHGVPFGEENKDRGPSIFPACPDHSSLDGGLNRWKASVAPGISTFFETRLTSIPVSSTTATTITSTSTTGSTAAATTTPAFLISQKTVRVGTGAYLPWVLGHGDGHHPNGIFLAPIAKVGFDSITGAVQQSNVVLPGNTIGTLNYQTAYNFFSFGGRVGHVRLPSSGKRAPLVDDYLDVTMGRFSNLQSFICETAPHTGTTTTPNPGIFTQTTCLSEYPSLYNPPAGTTATAANIFDVRDSRKSLYRVDIEGLIRIPIPATAIPFYLGFNANIAQHTVGAANLDHAYAPPDDIRIFFGTKIDIGSFLSKFGLGAN